MPAKQSTRPRQTRSTTYAANVAKAARRSTADRIALLKRARILNAQGKIRPTFRAKSK